MGAAMGYVAHKIVTGKAQPSPATLEEWLLQGAGIAVGRYAGRAIEASRARQKQLKLPGHAPSMKLAAETEQLAALAKRVEAEPQAKDALELLQKRHAILTAELKVLEDIAKSPELLKRSGMDPKQLASARGAIQHQLAAVHSRGFGDVPLHLAGLKELIPGTLWTGTRKQVEAAVHTAMESGTKTQVKDDPHVGAWHVEIEGRKITIEERFDPRAPAQARPQHERSSHDGHAGAYVASARVQLAGETHHVRIKQLDNGDWIITLCTRCARVRDLIQGAKLYFEELAKAPGRDPHGATAPANIAKILKPLDDIHLQAAETETALKKRKLTQADAEAVAAAVAQKLFEVVKKSPALEPLLGVGSRSMISLEQQGIHVKSVGVEALSAPAMSTASLGSKWVELAKTHDVDATARELAKAGIEATQHRGQKALEGLAKKYEGKPADLRQRAAIEAREAIIDEYLRRVEDGADTQARNAVGDARIVQAADKVKRATALARGKAKASIAIDARPPYTNAGDFELRIHNMDAGIRVAEVVRVAKERAEMFGFKESNAISKLNGRLVFENKDASLYLAVDTQHGRFEVLTRSGKHQREVNFDGAEVKSADPKTKHDLRVK
jgi:hypothetical protein